MAVIIHTNLALENQTLYADWLAQGFRRHGLEAVITGDATRAGDLHVVQGPHYAFEVWRGRENVLYLDRCFWGDAFEFVTIGWLNADGSRAFPDPGGTNGDLPELKAQKTRGYSTIVFGDYRRDPAPEIRLARKSIGSVYYRPHPSSPPHTVEALTPAWTLAECWSIGDRAIGYATGVLIQARIAGLEVISTDSRHVVNDSEDREEWIRRLSWAQWHYGQVRDGQFWEYLCEGIDIANNRDHAANC
jgi:hypothetical protein